MTQYIVFVPYPLLNMCLDYGLLLNGIKVALSGEKILR